jgi:hypothetical protein
MAYADKCAIEHCNKTAVYGVAKIRYRSDERTEYRVFTRPILPDEKLQYCSDHAWAVRNAKEFHENG